jgi:hypothetical protein
MPGMPELGINIGQYIHPKMQSQLDINLLKGLILSNCEALLPYLSSDDAYSRIHYLGKWDEDKERKLYEMLDFINDKGGSFLLSNVVENNGKWNRILEGWSKKYNVIDVSASYENCNYQRKNAGKTKEIMVRNY